jgi:hypothetical protein
MRALIGLTALAACLPDAAAAQPAERHWHCEVSDRIDGSFVMLWQAYRGPDRPSGEPLQQIVPDDLDGPPTVVTFSMSTRGTWPALDAPFEPPSRITVGIPLPEEAASREITLYAPGVAPIVARLNRWRWGPGHAGVSVNMRDRRQALALLTNRNWTAILHFPDERVQHVVPFRMPMDVARLRALRERQLPMMRALGRDPAARCRPHDEAD